MKNYIIAILAVCLLVSISFIYKIEQKLPFDNFPGCHQDKKIEDVENPLFLYFFFSGSNCMDCLEIIDVLNTVPEQFIVLGVVPDKELKNEAELRARSGASFDLIGAKNFKKYSPHYWPTLMGISKGNRVMFVLPGVPNEKEYLVNFLEEFYKKAYPGNSKFQIGKTRWPLGHSSINPMTNDSTFINHNLTKIAVLSVVRLTFWH
jgi:hypothetical protein